MLAGEQWEEVVRDGVRFRVNRESAQRLGPAPSQSGI